MTPDIGNESLEGATAQEGLTEMKFPVVLHKDADSEYGVIIPDVPGCFSAGATVAQAFENVKEALSLHYEGLVADGDPLPQVREIDAHIDNPDYAGGVWGWSTSISRLTSASRCASTPRCLSSCLSVSTKRSGGISDTAQDPVFWLRPHCVSCRNKRYADFCSRVGPIENM